MVPHKKSRKPVLVRPELAAELAPLAAQCGITDREALKALPRVVAAHGPTRELGLIENGQQVAAHLQQLGLQREQLGLLLLRCSYLFSWPADQRAAVLFGQLMGLGLTAAEAARCFEQAPVVARMRSFEPAIKELGALFAAASGASIKAGKRQLVQLLRKSPTAVRLLNVTADKLQQRLDNLQQRYGLSVAQLVAAMNMERSVLCTTSAHLTALEAVLQDELGCDGHQLFSALLATVPRVIDCGAERLRQRVKALVKVSCRLPAGTLKLGHHTCACAERMRPSCLPLFCPACRCLAGSAC